MYSPIQAVDWPTELGTMVVSGTFLDTSKPPVAVVPTSASWSLFDGQGNVVNSRSNVALPLLSTYLIVLTGADLSLTNGKARSLVIRWTFDSSVGTGLTANEEMPFSIIPITGIP